MLEADRVQPIAAAAPCVRSRFAGVYPCSRHTALSVAGWMLSVAAIFMGTSEAAFADPQAPSAERVVISELPLPPSAPSEDTGSCTNKTGCLDPSDEGIAEGPSYTWDGHHVLLPIKFAGAPAGPDPASIYSGDQVIAIKTDGTTFKNGDAWKCITCGVADSFHANRQRPAPLGDGGVLVDHPQPMHDGKRALIGTNILACGTHQIVADDCTPQETRIYPIAPHLQGAILRELRLHPDDIHIGFNQPILSGATFVDQFGVFARLVFDAEANRYELRNVSFLVSPDPQKSGRFIRVDPKQTDQLLLDAPAGVIGEFRGFTSDGKSALGIGTADSWNMDLFATDLSSGTSRRLTRDPAYADPARMSPDDQWMVFMDGRVNDRMYFAGALPGVPPLIDMVTATAIQYLYNNGHRRFFEPFVVRTDGIGSTGTRDRNIHDGFQLNGTGDPNIGDPLWNGRADPAWSPDGTNIVYWQAQVVPPACGSGQAAAPTCPKSNEAGGRRTRLMIARLTTRQPVTRPQPPPVKDEIPWGIPLKAGDVLPKRTHLGAGTYTLKGRKSGEAKVVITETPDRSGIAKVEVTYTNYSHDGVNTVNGTESGTSAPYTWHADLKLSGLHEGTRKTSEPEGFVVTPPSARNPLGRATITGTLTTTLDGRSYSSPKTGE